MGTDEKSLHKKILILKLSALGDIVMTIPLLKDLRKAFPQAEIDWLVNKNLAEVLKGQKDIRRLLLFERKEWGRKHFWKNRHSFFRLLKELKTQKYDLVLDLQGLLRSGFLAFCTRSSQRVGFENAREMAPLFYSLKVKVPTVDVYALTRYQSLLEAVGVPISTSPDFEIPIAKEEEEFVLKTLGEREGPFLGVIPQTMWNTKIWGTTRLAEVIERLKAHCTPVIFGSPGGEEEGERLTKASAGKALNLIGKTTIAQLFAFLKQMDVVLTNDSGPMHMAAALKVPLVAIFGPTNPLRTGPFPWGGHKIFHATEEISCAPCYKRKCPTQMECMQAVQPKEVADSLLEILEKQNETA